MKVKERRREEKQRKEKKEEGKMTGKGKRSAGNAGRALLFYVGDQQAGTRERER